MFVKQDSLEAIEFEGLQIVDYTAGRDLDSSLAFISVPVGAAHAEAYSKRSDKYYLVIDGAVLFCLEGHEETLSKGDFCFVERGRHFSYRNIGAVQANLVLVHTPSFRLDQEVFVK